MKELNFRIVPNGNQPERRHLSTTLLQLSTIGADVAAVSTRL